MQPDEPTTAEQVLRELGEMIEYLPYIFIALIAFGIVVFALQPDNGSAALVVFLGILAYIILNEG